MSFTQQHYKIKSSKARDRPQGTNHQPQQQALSILSAALFPHEGHLQLPSWRGYKTLHEGTLPSWAQPLLMAEPVCFCLPSLSTEGGAGELSANSPGKRFRKRRKVCHLALYFCSGTTNTTRKATIKAIKIVRLICQI